MQFPRTLLEFQSQFPDDAHCWAYLRRVRWPRGFVCPHAAGAGEATSWQVAVSSSAVHVGIRARLLEGPCSMGPGYRFGCGS